MRIASLLCFCLIACLPASAQLQFQNITHDYGTIPKARKLLSEFVVTNTGATDEYILRLSGSGQFAFVFVQEMLKPGQSDTVKLFYTPQQKGSFSEKIQVYMSSSMEPVTLSIKGTVGQIDPDPLSVCYSFKANHIDQYQAVAVTGQTITVIDKATGKPIPDAFVQVYSLSDRMAADYTQANGKASFVLSPNLYELRIRADFYKSKSQEQYLNKNSTDVVVMLERTEETIDTALLQSRQLQAVRIDSVPVVPPADTAPAVVTIPPKDSQPAVVVQTNVQPKPELVNGLLNPEVYAPNNIVFLLDISGSMQQETRLPALKKAMKDLAGQLRPEDKITILAYNESVKVVFATGYVTDKNFLYKQIDTLKAGGLTATDRGLKMAYEMARKAFISGGNNQVILATDGVFGVSETEKATIQKEGGGAEPVVLSVMGFGLSTAINDKLTELATTGGGSFFSGRGPAGLTSLANEIKTRSHK